MKKYFRVKCNQNNVYMAFGYNSESYQQLCSEYLDYKSNDWDCEETEEYYRSLPVPIVLRLIKDDEFTIEESETKFESYREWFSEFK